MGDPVIRLLTLEDLDSALMLSSTAGWNQRLADWRMLLTLAPGGCFAAIGNGRAVGTAIGIDYGGFGWIAMMLVDSAYRGRGLGRRLLEAAIASVPSDRPIRLDATPMGRPLYQAYGFEDEAMLTRYVAEDRGRRVAFAADQGNVRALVAADLPIVTQQDREIFGGDRGVVLGWLLGDAPSYARVVQGDTGVVHYCLGRHGRLCDQIGPILSSEDTVARALVSASLLAAEGRALLLDVFDARSAFASWLCTAGFRVHRPLFRMRRAAAGRDSTNDRRKPPLVEYAIVGPEFA